MNALKYFQTKRLVPTKEGSHFSVYWSKPAKGASEKLREYVQAEYDRGFGSLETFIHQDIENARATVG